VHDDDLEHVRSSLSIIRGIVAGLSPWRPWLDPGSGHLGFRAEKCGWDRFSPSTSVSSDDSHSTNCSMPINYAIMVIVCLSADSIMK
jgi:hypothetical protein